MAESVAEDHVARGCVVRTATAVASVHPSKLSAAGSIGGARWSMNHTESKPAFSAVRTRSTIVS